MKTEKYNEFYIIFAIISGILFEYASAYNAFMAVKRMAFLIISVFFVGLLIKRYSFNSKSLKLFFPLALSFLVSAALSRGEVYSVLIVLGFELALLFVSSQSSILSTKSVRKVFFFTVLASFAAVIISLYQQFALHNSNPFYASSTLGNQNFLAGVLAMITPLYYYFIFSEKKYAFAGPLLLNLFVILRMGSRGANIALVVGTLFYIYLFKKFRRYLLLIAGLIIISVFAIPSAKMSVLNTMRNLHSGSTGFRFIGWQSTINIFTSTKDKIFGRGLNGFEIYFPKYRRVDIARSLTKSQNPNYAHNDYLQLLVENGLFGLSAFLLIVYFALRRLKYKAIDPYKISAASVLVVMLTHSLFSFPLYRPASAIIFWVMLGITLRGENKRLRLKGLSILLAAFFLGVSVLYVMRVQGSIFFNIAYHSIDRNYKKALIAGKRAQNIWHAHYKAANFAGMAAKRLYKKNGYKDKLLIDDVISSFRTTLRLRPYHSYYNFNLGQSYIFRGMRDKDPIDKAEDMNNAIYFLRRAIMLDKNAISYYNELALSYKEKGEYAKAIKIFEKYINLGAKDDKPYINLGNIYFDNGDMKKALHWYFKALSKFPQSSILYYYIGASYYWAKDNASAVKFWKKYLVNNNDKQIKDFIKRYDAQIK